MNSIPAYKLTVVIPAYKAERTIRRAIDSALHQEGCDTTVIVVVDGNLDSTAQIARGYRDPRVHILVNSENKGVQFTRNRGLDLVKDEFVMFLDADDFVEGPLFAGLVREMRTSGADLGLGPMQTLLETKGGRGPITVLNADSVQDIFTEWLADGRFVSPCSVLWRTSFLRGIGGWDLDLHRQEDGELVTRAILLGARVVRSDHGRGIYVIHDSADRLTQRSDNLESLLLVPEKLLGINSRVIAPDAVKQACAASYYNAAQTCFTRGRGDLGREALRRSRKLGFRGHRGRAVHKFISYAIGLRTRCELERSVRRSIVPHLGRLCLTLPLGSPGSQYSQGWSGTRPLVNP